MLRLHQPEEINYQDLSKINKFVSDFKKDLSNTPGFVSSSRCLKVSTPPNVLRIVKRFLLTPAPHCVSIVTK